MSQHIFPDFQVFVGQTDLLFSNTQSIAEIYKIHGCASQPNSLVLTTNDYRTFHERNPYLAAKLLTIFVEHPVIFLGYSLSDSNIISILNSIASCLTSSNIEKLRDRLIFVQRNKTDVPDSLTSSVIAVNGNTVPVTIALTNDFTSLYEALNSVERRLPAKVLRQVKEHVYELVRDNDPQSRLHVLDLEEETDESKVEIVYGVGAISKTGELGLRGIGSEDIFKELILDKSSWDCNSILQTTLPNLLKQTPYIPIFKYLRLANLIDQDGQILMGGLPEGVALAAQRDHLAFRSSSVYHLKKESEVQSSYTGVKNLVEVQQGNARAMWMIALLRPEQIDLSELLEYLIERMELIDRGESRYPTNFRKIACLYDYLRYGPHAATSTYADAELGSGMS